MAAALEIFDLEGVYFLKNTSKMSGKVPYRFIWYQNVHKATHTDSENVWFVRGLATFRGAVQLKGVLNYPLPLKYLKIGYIIPPGAKMRYYLAPF